MIGIAVFPTARGLINFAVVAVASASIAMALLPGIVRMLEQGGLTRTNFKGAPIPSGVGILFPIASLISLLGLIVFTTNRVALIWIAVIFGMGFIGLLDDAAGDRTTRGLKGHLKALIHMTPTTGSVKALIGGMLSIYAGWELHGQWFDALLTAGLIALTTNAVNLLDVRPGRALKGFFLLIAIAVTSIAVSPIALAQTTFLGVDLRLDHVVALAAPLGVAITLFAPDLRGKIMLGDTGSNVLGASAGLLFSTTPIIVQFATLLTLTVLHVIAERSSITSLIERVPALDWLDRWGR